MKYLSDLLPYLLTFVLGVLMGAGGKYLADKYTDKRRERGRESKRKKLFIKLAMQMNELIKEMHEDLSNPQNHMIREFFILPNNHVMFNPGEEKYLYYFQDRHEDLLQKIKLLENNGFISNITHTNAPKYLMTEEFSDFVICAKCASSASMRHKRLFFSL